MRGQSISIKSWLSVHSEDVPITWNDRNDSALLVRGESRGRDLLEAVGDGCRNRVGSRLLRED